MVQLVSRASDVRITEINLSSVITSASSSIGCIPIISAQGSTDPRHFTNSTDFLFEYGDPDPSISMTTQAALNFFTEGNDLWSIRVPGTGAVTSGLLLVVDASVMSLKSVPAGVAAPTETDLNALAKLVSGSPTAEGVALFYANRGPGSYGDGYSVAIEGMSPVPPTNLALTTTASPGSGTPSNASAIYKVTAFTAAGESLPATVNFAGASNVKVNLTWGAVQGAVGYRVYREIPTLPSSGLLATVGSGTLAFTDAYTLTVDTTVLPPTTGAVSREFTVSIYDNTNPLASVLEQWQCTLTPKIDASGVQMEIENRINPFSSYLQVVSGVAGLTTVPASVPTLAIKALDGGDSGSAPTASQVALALQVFNNKQLYGVNILINGGMADPVLQLAMDTLVQGRGDAVALLDVPSSKQKFQAAIDYRNLDLNLNSTYSALFCPDLLQADLINGQQVYNPPSGWAAALCARTDRVANPAYSIAGLNRGLLNVLKARYQYDDGQASALYNAQVNYTRTFVGQGIALWEQRTMAGQFSALSWLSVRRIVNVIKVSLYKFLLYALQEMNTDTVRRQLVNSCTSYLSTVKAADGIFDFTVVCDNSNNPPAARDSGILVLTVVLIPNIPIHEIQLQVVISKSGVSFKETLSQVTGQ
jgi:hypothetical protein